MDKNEERSFGHGLAGTPSCGWSTGGTCWRGDKSANRQVINDTTIRAKRMHAVA